MDTICGLQLQQKLGAGTFGTVYLVSDETNSYALKIPHQETIDVSEYDILRKAQSPYLLQAIKFYTPFNCPSISTANILMPLAKYTGYDVVDQITDLSQLITIMDRCCQGLECLHKLGYIHNDIKPDNIVFYQATHPALSDFGKCINSSSPITLRVRLSSLSFSAPELLFPLAGDQYVYSDKSDVWALGATFYFWLLKSPLLYTDNIDKNVYKYLQTATSFETLASLLMQRYGSTSQVEDVAIILSKMLSFSPVLRYDAATAVKSFEEMTDLPRESECLNRYRSPVDIVRLDLDSYFTLARERIGSFIGRLYQVDSDISMSIVYILIEAFWRCYFHTEDEFDRWDALIFGIYNNMYQAIIDHQNVPDPKRLGFRYDRAYQCQLLALTYSFDGLFDFSYYYELKNRQNVDNMIGRLTSADPYGIVFYYTDPKSRRLVNKTHQDDLSTYRLKQSPLFTSLPMHDDIQYHIIDPL